MTSSDESPPSSSQRKGAGGREGGAQRRVLGDRGVSCVPVPAVAGRDLVQPVLRAVERGRRGLLGDVADADHVPLELAQAGVDHRRLGRDEADPPGRHREALAEAADEDHVRRAPRARELALVDAALVRLVGDDRETLPGREREELVDLGSRRQVPVGVVRVRQDEGARARRHRSLDRLRIPAGHRHEDAARALDQAAEEVARDRHDHLVARLEQRPEHEAERVHGAVRDQDPALGIRPAPAGERAIASRSAT